MRPTGVVLIALYHFVGAIFLVVLAIFLVVGGSVVGAMFGAGHGGPAGLGLGLLVGVLGGAFVLVFALIAIVAGYGVWTSANGDASCVSCWPSSPFSSRFPVSC